MASNKTADREKERRRARMEAKRQSNKKKSKSKTSSNGTVKANNHDEPEALIVPSSSTDSQNKDEDDGEDALQVDDSQEEEEDEAKDSGITNQRSNKPDDTVDRKGEKGDTKKNKKKKKKKNEIALYRFPMHRVNRIIKSDDSDTRITQEAVFLINKASEKFLELFCKEGYASSVLDRKKFVGYQHLSSVVSKRRRFDFLSDFVPEKVKAEDALAEIPSEET